MLITTSMDIPIPIVTPTNILMDINTTKNKEPRGGLDLYKPLIITRCVHLRGDLKNSHIEIYLRCLNNQGGDFGSIFNPL